MLRTSLSLFKQAGKKPSVVLALKEYDEDKINTALKRPLEKFQKSLNSLRVARAQPRKSPLSLSPNTLTFGAGAGG